MDSFAWWDHASFISFNTTILELGKILVNSVCGRLGMYSWFNIYFYILSEVSFKEERTELSGG